MAERLKNTVRQFYETAARSRMTRFQHYLLVTFVGVYGLDRLYAGLVHPRLPEVFENFWLAPLPLIVPLLAFLVWVFNPFTEFVHAMLQDRREARRVAQRSGSFRWEFSLASPPSEETSCCGGKCQ